MSLLSPTILQNREAIAHRVAEIGSRITRDFRGTEPIVLGVLNGAFVFMADLVRAIDLPVRCGFVQVRRNPRSDLLVEISFTCPHPLEGQPVLLVEDILDTGITLSYLRQHLEARGASRVATCVLLDKPVRRRIEVLPEYVGFTVPDIWVVGYGLDHQGLYRGLPFLTSVEPERELSSGGA
jgi:hypoxanthine phosphoribosyltransferase